MATVSAPRPFSSISFWTPAGALWALWTPGSASASGTVSALVHRLLHAHGRALGALDRLGLDLPRQHRVAFGLDRRDLAEQQFEPIQLASDLRLHVRAQRTPVAGASRLQRSASIPAQRLVIADPLRKQQAFDPIDMPYPLGGQRLALATNPAAVLVLRRGNPHHRAHPRLAALERQQRAQQPLAIDLVGLGAATTPRNRDRGRVHHVALDSFLHQRPVDPEPVEPGFLNDDDRIGFSRPSQNLVADRPKTGQETGQVSRL